MHEFVKNVVFFFTKRTYLICIYTFFLIVSRGKSTDDLKWPSSNLLYITKKKKKGILFSIKNITIQDVVIIIICILLKILS